MASMLDLTTLSQKFAGDKKIRNSVILDNDRQNLQEDLNKVSAWSDKWELPLTTTNAIFSKWEQETTDMILKFVV